MTRAALWLGAAWLAASFAAAAAEEAPPAPPAAQPVTLPPALSLPEAPDVQGALERLRAERDEFDRLRRRITADRVAPAGPAPKSSAQMRSHISGLLKKVAERKPPAPTGPGPAVPPPDPLEPRATPSAGHVQLAQLQYRSRDFAAAQATLAAADRAELTARDRAWLDYLKACCLRQQGKLAEAAVVYREVAAGKADPVLSEAAAWHVTLLSWRQEAEARLDSLRKQSP